MIHLLLAEDDLDFGSILKQYLELHAFKVHWFTDGKMALEEMKKHQINLCILDVMMPKTDGFTLAKTIIDTYPETPFLFLTARGQKEDKIKGLKLGADDYILKPFEADELVLRIKNILKRYQHKNPLPEEENYKIGAYTFSVKNQILTFENSLQRLTEKEVQLLLFLVKNKNELLNRERILSAVWGQDDFFSGRSMDVFISRLRKYLSKDKRVSIESVRGKGLELKIETRAKFDD